MYNLIILFIKGMIIGIGKIIPGVSGAVIAMSLGVYEEAIKAVNNFFKNISHNLKFLMTLGLGVIASIILISNLIKFFLNQFYLPTMLLFIGLILGGVSLFLEEFKDKKISKSNISIAVIIFIIMLLITFLSKENNITFFSNINNFVLFLILGFIEAVTMIIPGISGTAIYMLIGCYDKVIDLLINIFNLNNLKTLFPFGIGIVIGALITVKLMDYLFNNYKMKTYMVIIGFSLSSTLLLIIETLNNNYSIIHIIIGLLFLVLGYTISRKIKSKLS